MLRWIVLFCACAARGAASEPADFALENPAPGIYVHYGQQADMSRANLGDVANVGFVVGTRCIAVIDTGGTYAVGRALRQAIRRTTALPVCYVINTHVHPDHIFGNAAFSADRPAFVGHARLADAMQRRAPNYLAALRRDLGEAAEHSVIVPPTHAVAETEELDIGGRTLQLRAWKTAHTDTDLTVFDRQSRTLWLGDLLFVGHVPVVDGSLNGFLAAVAELKRVPADRAVPGHGRAPDWPGAMDAQERYLRQLRDEVRAAIKTRRTLAEAVATVGHGAEHWLLLDTFHKRNVTAAYAELEWEE